MALLWMLKGPKAGQFVSVDDDTAQTLIEAGEAQPANTPAHKIKVPDYQTRELRAEEPGTASPAPKAKARAKRKPRKRKHATA